MKDKFKKFKVKLKQKWELIKYHENRYKIKAFIPIFIIRSIKVVIIGMSYLLVLRLFGYSLTYLNLLSCMALYFILQEVPDFIKRCRK